MKVYGRQCKHICKDIIWSRAGHDFKHCTCGDIFVDGGQGEFGGRIGYGSNDRIPESVEIELHGVENRDFYNDWNHRKDTFGRIKAGTIDLRQQVVAIGDVRFDKSSGTKSDDVGPESDRRIHKRPEQ